MDAAKELRSFMSDLPGIYEISDSTSLGKRHFEIELTPVGKAAGLTPAMLGRQFAREFQWRGGSAHPAWPRRDQGDGAISHGTAPESARACERAHHTTCGRRSGRAAGCRCVRGGSAIHGWARLTETRELATLTRIDGKQAALGQRACRHRHHHSDSGEAADRRRDHPRSAGEVPRPEDRAPRGRPGDPGDAGNPGPDGAAGAARHVRAHGGLPSQLLEAARRRGGHPHRVRRLRAGPLDTGVGLHGDVGCSAWSEWPASS